MVLKKISKKKLQNFQNKLIAKYEPKSMVSEHYRKIRTSLEYWMKEDARILMITSAEPNEGKTTTVSNLAAVFVQKGKKVLLIDGDLRKPNIHYCFDINNNVGLSSVLLNQCTLANAIKKDNEYNNLFILPSGPIPQNPSELLGSSELKNLLKDALEQFDLILIDTPPILAVADAQILSNQCDGTILVARSGKSEVEHLTHAKELLSVSTTKLFGVILNNSKDTKSTNKHRNYYI